MSFFVSWRALMCSSPWPHPSYGPTRCGQCMECRLAYSREWAIRMTHEQQMHDRSCFLTLTYSDANLPRFGQLVKRDLQLFFKRARKAGHSFRYVACGEYGDVSRRPHFHCAIFGVDFSADRVEFGVGVRGDKLFISPVLSSLWGKGHASIGSLTFESAAYIARYITKRVSGVGASPLPLFRDDETGELVMPNPEFLLCSRRPGIGCSWFRDFFMCDVYPHGRVITQQGTPAPVPAFYKRLLKEVGGDLSLRLQFLTSMHQGQQVEKVRFENSVERRAARDSFSRARTGAFKRELKE